MCSICHKYPCDTRCPNAPEPHAIYTCKHCGEPIIAGDEYLELDGDYYHMEDCAGYVAVTLLMEKCGAISGIAEEETEW